LLNEFDRVFLELFSSPPPEYNGTPDPETADIIPFSSVPSAAPARPQFAVNAAQANPMPFSSVPPQFTPPDISSAGFTLDRTLPVQFTPAHDQIAQPFLQISRTPAETDDIDDALNETNEALQFFMNTDTQRQIDEIRDLTNRISAERFKEHANIDILLATLIDSILQILNGGGEIPNGGGGNFFELLNRERTVKLDDALTDFDFFNNNPYKDKAERRLAKIEAKKNKR
jgi:hypothetical protein